MNIVVAACKNNGIGINNKLPWMLRNDLKYFKFLTQSHGSNAIVMGKNTCFSLPRALPKRVNYVLSTSLDKPQTQEEIFLKNGGYGDFRIIKDINHISTQKYDNVWLIGGAQVYENLINNDLINSIYYTNIDAEFKCDTFFPEIPEQFVKEFESKSFIEDEINFNMEIYVKKGLESIEYINRGVTAMHYAELTLG